MNKEIVLSIGIIGGYIYYLNMKNSIKEHYRNCSFVANKLTDYFAFLVGGIILYLGYYKYNDNYLIIFGTGIITEHILQFSYKIN